MRCKKHYADLSSSIGVCACCLRERLISLIAAEEQQQQQQAAIHNVDEKHRSIPLIANLKPDHSVAAAPPARHHHTLSDQQFYTEPAVHHNSNNKKKSLTRFFSFQNIFRSKNRNSIDSVATSSSTSNTSWFSTILHGGRVGHHHRRKPSVCANEVNESDPSSVVKKRQYCRDRGMSPVRNSDKDDLQNDINETPKRTPLRRGAGAGAGGHVRNLSFCLSPLVRASPNRQWNQPENVMAGEIRGPHLSNTKSFCANRSRKLADFGRTNPNR